MMERFKLVIKGSIILSILLYASVCFSAVASFMEEDGDPDLYIWRVKVPNGTLTDNGDGTASLSFLSAGGGTVTGNINIQKVDPEIRLTDTGDSEYTRWTRTDTTGKAMMRNRCYKPAFTGNALEFAPGANLVVIPKEVITGKDWTIAFWEYAATGAADGYIIVDSHITAADLANLLIMKDTGGTQYDLYSVGDASGAGLFDISQDAYHLVIITHTAAGDAEVFVDNVSEDTIAGSNFVALTYGLGVGNRYSTDRDYEGKIDDIMIWSRVLTSNDRTDLWNSGDGIYVNKNDNFPTDGTSMGLNLEGLYHLDESAGATAYDSSAYSRDATLYNMVDADWVAGKIGFAAGDTEVAVWTSQDGVGVGEEGIQTYGDPDGRTIIEGKTIRFNIAGVEEGQIDVSGNWDLEDSNFTTTGTGTFGDLTVDTDTLYVDKTNNRVGIGTSAPDRPLELRTGSSIIRLRDTGDTATSTLSHVEFGGTTTGSWNRTGYVGDSASGDTHIRLRAEDSDLILGDSSGASVLTLSGGDVTASGALEGATLTEGGNAVYSSGEAATFASLTLGDSEPINFGAGTDAVFQWDETQTRDSLQLGLATGNNEYSGIFAIMQLADMGHVNRDPTATSTEPRFRVYSDDEAQSLDFVEIFFDAWDGATIRAAKDDLTLSAQGTDIRIDGAHLRMDDGFAIQWGGGIDTELQWTTTGNDSFQLGLQVGSTSRTGYFSIIERADLDNANRSPTAAWPVGATSPNPVLGILSSDATTAADGVFVWHDQTIGHIWGYDGLSFDSISVYKPSATQVIDAAGDTLLANATMVVLNPDGDYTMTSTPTIANGTTGQILHIVCANAEANTVTVQDQGTLGSSNLELGAASRAISGKDVLALMFDGTTWIEMSYVNN